MQDDDVFEIIDPPVTEFSTPQEIRAWIVELESIHQSKGVKEELDKARKMLTSSEKIRKQVGEQRSTGTN